METIDIHNVVDKYNNSEINAKGMEELLNCTKKVRQRLLKENGYILDRDTKKYILGYLVEQKSNSIITSEKKIVKSKQNKSTSPNSSRILTLNLNNDVYLDLKIHVIKNNLKISEFVQDLIKKELKKDRRI